MHLERETSTAVKELIVDGLKMISTRQGYYSKLLWFLDTRKVPFFELASSGLALGVACDDGTLFIFAVLWIPVTTTEHDAGI